jgi:hypothetical protein
MSMSTVQETIDIIEKEIPHRQSLGSLAIGVRNGNIFEVVRIMKEKGYGATGLPKQGEPYSSDNVGAVLIYWKP